MFLIKILKIDTVIIIIIDMKMKDLLKKLYQGQVIIYPTESVFGLGCDPDSERAIYSLLTIKNRSWKKGFILVAANYKQLMKYIDDNALNEKQRCSILSNSPNPITWIVPAHINTPYWLTGKFSSLAVRISRFEPIRRLCLAFGKPLVSTSANISGFLAARTILEINNQFEKYNLLVMHDNTLGGFLYPSTIKNIITGEIIRK